jgi:hypothetical protein
MKIRMCGALMLWLLIFPLAAHAADGKLLATGGLVSVEGTAGGGLTPWAVIAGYGEANQIGAAAALSYASLDDYSLRSGSVALGLYNRVELSLAQERLDFSGTDVHLGQRIFGAKVRLAGDLIYDNMPQLSLGVQRKASTSSSTLRTLGIDANSGTDVYISAGRVWLNGPFGRNFLLNGTLRNTAAQQTGLLGFARARNWEAEATAALLLNRRWALGGEYRQKPDAFDALKEDDWKSVFLAYFPNKNLSFALAYLGLGAIGGKPAQNGYFLTVQGAF